MNRIFCNFHAVGQKLCLRNVHTSFQACAKTNNTRKNPGISKRAEIFKNDVEFIESLEDEEDIAGLESNFSDADLSYNEHRRMERTRKIKIGKMITKKKFFADPPQPSMLTWLERIQIKKLHSEDPETWSLDVLADSFPAPREVISKILKQKWQPDNVKKMKKMDARVHENWLLLAEGRLEADPVFLEHVRRFLPRREDHLAELKSKDVAGLLNPPKEKPVWNGGQMSKILESYEKALDALEVKKERVMIGAESDREVIDERVQFEKLCAEGNDSVVIGGDGKSKLTTLSELKETLTGKETKGNLNLFEKVMLEQGPSEKVSVNDRLTNLAGYGLEKKSAKRESHRSVATETVPTQTSEQIQPVSEEPVPKEVTEMIMQVPENPPQEEIQPVSEEPVLEKVTEMMQEKPTQEDSFHSGQSEKLETDVEAKSIEDTFFWPSAVVKNQETESTLAKKKRIPVYHANYAQRITIPKNKKGSGLTFQVNDCFYDDDGEFLYRVPGMTAQNKS